MKIVMFLVFIVAAGGPAALAGPLDVDGVWQTQAADGHVRVADCGDGTPCGELVWVAPSAPGGGLDAKNPDPALKSRALTGITIVWGYRRGGDGWKGGRIYNPQDGKTFRSRLRLTSADTLEVKGCLGPICRKNVWTRVSKPNGGGS